MVRKFNILLKISLKWGDDFSKTLEKLKQLLYNYINSDPVNLWSSMLQLNLTSVYRMVLEKDILCYSSNWVKTAVFFLFENGAVSSSSLVPFGSLEISFLIRTLKPLPLKFNCKHSHICTCPFHTTLAFCPSNLTWQHLHILLYTACFFPWVWLCVLRMLFVCLSVCPLRCWVSDLRCGKQVFCHKDRETLLLAKAFLVLQRTSFFEKD